MTLLNQDIFVCLDIEATGLDPSNDRIVEIALVKFTFDKVLETFSTLIDPEVEIPKPSQIIHNISDDMVKGKPKIKEVLPDILKFINSHIIMGHGIKFDIDIVYAATKRDQIPCKIYDATSIDTLRLARLYGESPSNSLKELSKHFNVDLEGAHRALNDVKANIEVFKKLSTPFTTTNQMLKRLEKPIALKKMPLGKHKGRVFSEIPIEYLKWAAGKDFDQDLLFSIRLAINARKKKTSFETASNPFSSL
ncbi:MAG: DNA polymerase III PolC-type [Candidatus Anoxychlamydiales bacterium]|nr:DNA polymerase III PolC-type [Candidatus Anoxychlamydiales bacterium]